MAERINPNALTCADLARLINLAVPGTITEPQVRRQMMTAAWPLGRGRRINLVLYLAWLRRLLADGKRLRVSDGRSGATKKREQRIEARDIGAIPDVQDPARRESGRLDLARFLLTYFPRRFYLPFSPDHVLVVRKLEAAVLQGELYGEAVYRGFGKSNIAIGGAIWAALYVHREFVPVLAATRTKAVKILDGIKGELRLNPVLAADFPEVCFPVRALEGLAHRCPGQLYQGRPTEIGWGGDQVRFPTIPGSKASGVTIFVTGLDSGSIRGLEYRAPDGSSKRPDFVIVDDPQTDKSAASPIQCDNRESLISGAVLGMAGPDKKIAGLMTTTVIRRGDLAHRFLDRKRHPEWQGDTIPLVKRWAARHDDLWMKTYAELRRADLPDEEGGRELAERQAGDFYLANRAEMDAGAVVSWPEKLIPGEHSAVQNAYNLLIDKGPAVFAAEYQCAPLDQFEGIEPPLEPQDIMAKVNNLERYRAEHGASVIVSFVDCGKQTHVHWSTCWFGDGFSGGLLDRGVLPVERTALGGIEAALTATLTKAVGAICGRAYPAAGGGELRVSLCAVDSGWEARTVYAFCRQSPHAAVLVPSKGQGGELELRPPKLCGRRDRGPGWYYAKTVAGDARLLHYDVDHFKSFANERLRTPLGGRGSFSLWGFLPDEHRLFAEHCTAERPKSKTKRTGDVFAKWEVLPGRPNHWWDTLVGCYVAAARLGMTLDGADAGAAPARAPIKMSEVVGR